jgi:hypothetical protein
VWVRTATALAIGASVAPAEGASAQASDALYPRLTAQSGWETRGFTFDSGIGTRSVWQWSVPVVVVTPLGRKASVDLTTHYASGRLETYAGATETLSGLTDTQVRLLYSVSRDRLVGSVSLNLPTGENTVSASQFQVAGAVGANYLSFPVPNFGTAFGVTGGLAYAQRAGAWNLGLSGSVRYLGSYSPFSDDTLSYNPGVEARLRGGVDRLVGDRSRLLVGATLSTFSTDVYSGSSALASGRYHPGTRFIGELAFSRVIGRATVTMAAWDFYRLAGRVNDGSSLETKEDVFNAELRLTYPLAPRFQVEPMLGFRQWSPADYRGGRLKSAGVLARARVTDRLSATLAGRYDAGWIYARGTGLASLEGYGASLFLRYER